MAQRPRARDLLGPTLPRGQLRTGLTFVVHFDILMIVMGEPAIKDPVPDGACEVLLFDEELVKRARERILSDEQAQEIAEQFKMLAHPTRVQILRALADQELCVCDLAQVLDLSVSATSYQLQLMRRLKLVRYRRTGKFAYYRVSSEFVSAMLKDGLFHLGQCERTSP
ncbi:MAG: metalloregulator ArsR/SmtB family transcription factor [Acidobacteriota bacterium]|nr:metalloregulator ArsR/SmtB family transcription factor [Acidobacteriota bacterium]